MVTVHDARHGHSTTLAPTMALRCGPYVPTVISTLILRRQVRIVRIQRRWHSLVLNKAEVFLLAEGSLLWVKVLCPQIIEHLLLVAGRLIV